MSEAYQTYKNRPLVRSGSTIYYGSMAEPYVVMMQVTDEAQTGDIKSATEIRCYLMKTDKNLTPMQAIVKNVTLSSLFEALSVADRWLLASNR